MVQRPETKPPDLEHERLLIEEDIIQLEEKHEKFQSDLDELEEKIARAKKLLENIAGVQRYFKEGLY